MPVTSFGSQPCVAVRVLLILLVSATVLRLNTCLAALMLFGLTVQLWFPCRQAPSGRAFSGIGFFFRCLLWLTFCDRCTGAAAHPLVPFAATWEDESLSLFSPASFASSADLAPHLLFSGVGTDGGYLTGPASDARPSLLRSSSLLGQRLGEASNPGPAHFRISAANPTGVNNKFDLVAMLPPGIYGLSETHLTQIGLQRFRAALRRSSTFKFVPGAPVALRARSEVSGMYAGVGFLSSFPTRSVPCDWDPALFATGRLAACSFFIEPVWVLGVTLYGYATGRARTADLVRAAFDRVLAQPAGPRFVSGDFNLTLGEVPHLHLLRQHGFRELQEVAQIKFGREPVATCKQATRKDFVFLSPELQTALLGADLALDFFPDHSVLTGHFGLGQRDHPVFTWRLPKQRPVNSAQVSLGSGVPAETKTTADDRYTALWQQYENRLSHALAQHGGAPLDSSERGRAGTTEVRAQFAPVVPPGRGRQGELQPTWLGINVRHAHWYRQLRRLQALNQAVKKATDTIGAREHRASLWNAIRMAAGFGQGFSVWYLNRRQAAQ